MKQNLLTKLLVLIACACFIGNGWGQTTIGSSPYTITTSGTYTIPAGVTSIIVESWGGGGGGGGAKAFGSGSQSGAGGGGGGGAYTRVTMTVVAGQVYTATVGAGGNGGSNTGGNGTAGGTTTFTGTGGTCTAPGGALGTGATTDGGVGTGGNGGTGTTNGGRGGNGIIGGSFNNGGSGGGGAGNGGNGGNGTSVANGNGAVGTGGIGSIANGTASSAGGNGGAGRGASNVSGSGSAGTSPGGGGGGGTSYTSGGGGGAGAVGKIIITYSAAPTCTAPTSVALSGFTTPICSGSSPGTFTATATGGSPTTYTYLWYKDGVSTGTTTQTYVPGNLTANTDIYCAVSTGSGCTTNSPTTTITVVTPSAPVISNSLVCSGATVTWPAVSSADGYEMQVSTAINFSSSIAGNNCGGVGCGGGVSMGNVTSANVTNLTPGTTYYIRVRARCNGTTFSWSNTLTVVVPTSTSSTAPTSVTGTTSVCSGSSTTLTTSGGTLGTNAEDLWYSGSCPTDYFSEEWASQPYATFANTTVNSVTNGILNVTSTSNDPMIMMYGLGSYAPTSARYINIRYRVTGGTGGSTEIFFTNTTYTVATGVQDYANGALITDGAWHVLSIDMPTSNTAVNGGTNYYNTGGNITGWRFDWATNSGVTMDIDFITLSSSPIIETGTTLTVSPTSNTTYFTLKKGECNTTTCSSATVTVVQPPTTSTPGSNQTICQGTSATLAANIPSVGTGAWSVASGPNTSSTQFSNTASNASTFTPTAAGTYVLTWTISNSPCTASANTVTITSLGTTTAATVSAATLSVCGSLTSGSLGGNTPTNGTGTWSIVSGGTGSFSSVNSGSSTFTAGAYGTYVLRWTIANSPCASSTADVTVTFTPSIGFANTNFPTSGTICVGGTYSVYGKIFITGVTSTSGATSGLTAELGYSTSNTNPNTWTNWVTASYNAQVSNDDEYVATLTGLAAGTYYHAYRFSYNGCSYTYGGTGGIWSSTANNGILAVYALPSVTMNPSTICNGATSVSVSASGASTYELLVNGTSQGMASSTSSWTVAGPLSTGNTVCVRGYPSNSLVMNGDISEAFWGTNISNSGSGPGSGFGNNRINALYVRNGFGYLNLAVAGRLENDNKILLFLDTKTGGYNSLSSWSNRSNAPNNGLKNLNGGMQFDTGFDPDYVVSIGVDGSGVSFLDFYDMANNTSTFLGSTSSAPNLISYQTNTSASDYTKGYEIRIPINLIGSIASPLKLFGMLTNNPNSVTGTTLSNQFLSPAGSSQGNYGTDVGVNFNSEPPNPVFYTLNSDCYTDVCRTVSAIVTPTFNQVSAICSGGSLAALPTTSTNSITGTWAPALDNTQTTTYTFTPTAGLCANTTTMTITVNPTPTVVVSNNGPLCAGQTLNLTCNDSYSTYAWTGPSSFSSAVQNPTIASFVAGNAGTYTLIATDANGCQGTGTTTVSLSNAPTPSSNSPVCVGGSLSLSVGSASSYSWSGPNSFSSILQNPTVSASATSAMAGIYTISLIGSCAGTGITETFADGNYTSNPVWSVTSGGWQIYNISSTQYLYGDNAATVDVITTPSTQAYGTWNFDYSLQTTASTTSQVLRFFVTASSTALTTTNGYYVFVDGGGNLFLRKLTTGTATTLITSTWVPNTSWHTAKVVRNFNNTFELYLDGVLKGTSAADNSFTTSNYMGAWNSGAIASDNHRLDNISTIPPTTATTTVVVNSTPSISNKTGTICSGNTYTMATASPDVVPSGTTYTWTFTANPNITGAAIGTAQSSFAQTLTNTSSLPQTIVYSVTPSVGGSCAGTAFTVTITVDAPLNGGTVTTDQTICSGGTPTLLSSTLLPSGGSGLGITGSLQIGTQIWMNSNLNVVNYNDGTPVGTVFNTTAGAYTWYQDDYPTWGQYYGALYNWYAVNTGKLCPSGWHVPTLTEYTTLINLASGSTTAGKKLKSCRTVSNGCATTIDPRWDASSSAFGTDDYGFAALPAGREYWNSGAKQFERVQTRARFWTSTLNDPSNARAIEMNYNTSDAPDAVYPYGDGYSVRCMGDNATTIQNSYTYQWQQDPGCTGAWSNISGANSLTYQPGALTQTTCFRRITTDACGNAYSNTITITVNPAPAITAMTTTICSGTAFTGTPVDGTNGTVPVGTTYTWTAPVMSGVTGGTAQATAQASISQTLTNTTTSNGTATYTVTATSGTCTSTFAVTVTVLPPLVAGTVAGISSSGGGPGHLVIYQVYGGGGNSGATYTNDFVVLYNPTGSAVNLSGWSLQYAATAGTTWTNFSLSGTILSGGYFLVQLASGANGIALPTPDLSGTAINMATANGKIALVNSTTALTGSCPTTNVIDLVGFGTANCSEGSSAAPAPSVSTWVTRKLNGCQDTDVNSADFTAGNTTAPKNSASPTNFCTTISLTETICANATASSITATAATGSTGSFTYQWYSQAGNITCPTGSSTTGWTLIPGATSLTYSPGAVSSTTTYALFITPTGTVTCGGTWATDCRKVVVNPAPSITDMTTSVCSGIAFSGTPVDVTNGTVPSGTTYTWTVAANTNVTGQSAQTSAQSSISQTLTNTTTTSQTVVYTVTPTFGTCVSAAFTLTVTVNPSPIILNATISACTGVAFSHTPTGSNIPTGTTYSWSAPTGANFTGGASSSGSSTVDGTLTLSSGSSATAVYTVTPTSGTCSGNTFTVTVGLSSCAPPVPFTECNLVVYEVGDGTGLGSSAFPISIKELTPAGGLVQTVTNLFIGANQLTQSGASSSTGFLNSYNGFLAVPGLNSSLGTPSVTNQNTKVTHIINGNATLDTRILHPTSGTMPFTADNYRSVIPVTATTFYCSGTSSPSGTGGIWYYNGASFTQIFSSANNIRNIEIFNGNLYFTTGAGTRGLYQVGTGLPTIAGQTANLILSVNTSTSSPYDFSISPDGCTIYLTDDGNGGDLTLAGIYKFQNTNGTWINPYKYTAFTRGLVVDFKQAITKIYATTSISNSVVASDLIHITDNGSFSTPVWTLPAGLNYSFAGIDFTPNSTTVIANPITSQPLASASLCNAQTQTLSVTASGSPTYQWYSNSTNSTCGASVILGATSASYTPPATGIDGIVYYFVKVSINCSQIFLSNISAITTVINQTPVATNNGPICVGGTLTLQTPTVSGATYSWTGPNSFSSTTQNPTVTSNATIANSGTYNIITTINGCASVAGTTTVVVNQPPGINAISPP